MGTIGPISPSVTVCEFVWQVFVHSWIEDDGTKVRRWEKSAGIPYELV